MSGLGNAIQASMIKSFIPMIKENLPKLETQIGEVLRNVELEGMENYAAIVITVMANKAYITLCTFDIEDHLCRQVRSIPLAEFVEQILTGKFTI